MSLRLFTNGLTNTVLRLLAASLISVAIFMIPLISSAKTLVLDGSLKSRIRVSQQMGFSIDKPLNKLNFRFALPQSFSNKFVFQRVNNLNIKFTPEPSELKEETDVFGNRFRVVTWKDLRSPVSVRIDFEVELSSELRAEGSAASFPLRSIPDKEKIFLKPTKLIQSDSPDIIKLSRQLTSGATTEYEAVSSILNYVVDHVRYTYNPPQYDALWTLKAGTGNCQNFAHLSIALLRAAGIPARIVGGITLKESWKVPVDESSYLVQSMGQGGHAWIEIYFTDLGWLSYDPQQSKQFTSSRHIKQTHGLDSDDINDSWRASPYLPEYSELIEAKFISDSIDLRPAGVADKAPKGYLLTNRFIAKKAVPEIKLPEEKPEAPALPGGKTFEFGNMVFPNLVDLYQVVGDKGVRILDKETAEYVTSRYVYAQAFTIPENIEIEQISLAMRKFGGDGTVYIDLVQDEQGRPGMRGIRSNPLFLENISRRPGYYWVDFTFPERVKLGKGRYWIVLRHSGEVIMNWFYIPGNPYGEADDTRSTLKGYRWEDIQNFDFVFKIKANRL